MTDSPGECPAVLLGAEVLNLQMKTDEGSSPEKGEVILGTHVCWDPEDDAEGGRRLSN